MSVEGKVAGAVHDDGVSGQETIRTAWAAELGMIWSVVGLFPIAPLLATLSMRPESVRDFVRFGLNVGWHAWPFVVTGLVAFWSQRNKSAGWLSLIASYLGGVIGIGLLVLALNYEALSARMTFLPGKDRLLQAAPILQILVISPLLLAALTRTRGQGSEKKQKLVT